MYPSPEGNHDRLPKLGLIGSLLVYYKETEDGEIPVMFSRRPSHNARKPVTSCIMRAFGENNEQARRSSCKRPRESSSERGCVLHPPPHSPPPPPPPLKRIRSVPQPPPPPPIISRVRVPTTPTKASSGGEPAQPEEEAVNPDLMHVIRNLHDRLADFERDVNEREVRKVLEHPEKLKTCVKIASWQVGDGLLREFHQILKEELSGESFAKKFAINICTMRRGVHLSPDQLQQLRRNEQLLLRELGASEARLERFREIAEQTRIRGRLAMRLLLGVPNRVV